MSRDASEAPPAEEKYATTLTTPGAATAPEAPGLSLSSGAAFAPEAPERSSTLGVASVPDALGLVSQSGAATAPEAVKTKPLLDPWAISLEAAVGAKLAKPQRRK